MIDAINEMAKLKHVRRVESHFKCACYYAFDMILLTTVKDSTVLSILLYKTKSRNFKSHGLKAVGCLEEQMRAQ